jgi:hypothetical protein
MDDQDFIPRRAKVFSYHVPLTSGTQPASYSIGYVNSLQLDYEAHLQDHTHTHLTCVNPFDIPRQTVTLAPQTVESFCLQECQ